MATEKSISELVLNKVASQSVYDYMIANDLVNDDELYFVDDDNKYYTKTETDVLLNTKASNSNVYSKTEADNKYLALSGGTMTGQFATYSGICKADDTYWLDVCGGSAWNKGAFLCVSGKDSDRAGEFILCANNSTNFYELCGFPNGTLTWGGNNILTENKIVVCTQETYDAMTSPDANTYYFITE